MPQELPMYRAELEGVIAYFGQGKNILTKKEVMEYTGRGVKWVNAHLGQQPEYTARGLAHMLAKMTTRGGKEK